MPIKFRELIKVLEKDGWYIVSQAHLWQTPD